MRRCRDVLVVLALVIGILPLGSCGGGSGGGGGGSPLLGSPALLSEPPKWIDNDGDSVISSGDEIVFSFDRLVVAGANAPVADLVVGGGGGEMIVGATWSNGFQGDGTKMTLNVTAGDVLLSGKMAAGTIFNLQPANTLTNPSDGTVGATAAATAQNCMGNIKDTGQSLSAVLAFSIRMVDVDADGDKDIVMGTTGANTILINGGVNTGLFAAGGALVGEVAADTRGIGAGLLSFDTLPDLVAANSGVANANRVYLRTLAPPTFTTTNTVGRDLIGAANSNGVVVAQGFLFPTWDQFQGGEIFVANNGVNMVYYANAAGQLNGDGTLVGRPAPQAVGAAADTRAVVLGDLDQDGVEDVVICDDNGVLPGTITRYRVTAGVGAQATFTPVVLGGSLPAPRSLALCDVDEDTDLDIVVGYDGGGGMQVYLQAGLATGAFGAPLTFPGGDVLALTCTDLDGDGFDEIIQARGSGVGIAIWVNCGGGTFLDSQVRIPGTMLGLDQAGTQTPNPGEPFAGFDGVGVGDFVSAGDGSGSKAFTSAQK